MVSGSREVQLEALRLAITQAYRVDEAACLRERLQSARLASVREQAVQDEACTLAAAARKRASEQIGIEAFLQEYDVSSREGVLLMCLAEALLCIPDATTAERLIRDRLAKGHWDEHLGGSASLLVNASTWGLLLTGRLVGAQGLAGSVAEPNLKQLVTRLGEPVVRLALHGGMRFLAEQFVTGRDISEALRRASTRGDVRYSYDCLGEAARSAADVERYFSVPLGDRRYRRQCPGGAGVVRAAGRLDKALRPAPAL
jgi:RHH-type proline utilization regulon transcriptional repressor/proline dehydrogenase/delta 1-pyrroline-5-carboxylate dehydrogenase